MTEPAVVVDAVRVTYRDAVALDDVSLRVRPGEVLGVLGVNGAGKTTLVETIAGLRRPDAGTVRVLGLDPVAQRRAVRRVLGVQLQEARLHDALTVGELVDLHRAFHADPRPADEALAMVELTERRDVRFERLSGGQQQRLSVALALVGRPRVVVLDELTTGLDPRARRRLWATVESLTSETVLLVSHAMDEVERLCDRVVLLDAGRVVAEGSPAEVVDRVGAASLDEAFLRLTGRAPGEDEDAA
ncbi:ABC transporter ATP-binding protein [Nocardioides zeae]|uniref:ABC transporter ATP-binding protein n=1 Tax=Nocardioides imazamoxiresistens TaxID=3231893 RepID=A0ABU3Q1R3_9ACTN|nr:ABC transporter ATP-binding protein [Nocardioides zeae]MDT9595086.1 ABC transporter ATP-binding protein [Nocardioides zeae]